MNLENKIEAQRKRMEQEKNKLDMLMKKAKIEQRKADNHRKIVVGANFETFLNEPRRYSEEQTRRIMQVAFATTVVGLFSSAIGFITQQVKQRWYLQDMTNLEFLSELLNQNQKE